MSKLSKRVAAIALGSALALATFRVYVCAARELASLTAPPIDPVWLAKAERLEQLEPLAHQRRDTILASLKEGVAGESYGEYENSRSGFESHEFDIAPCGFFFEYQTCTGTQELAYGNVVSVAGSRIRLEIVEDVVLAPPEPHGSRQRFRLGTELYSVPWGAERVLVPAELMQEFCTLAKATGWSSMQYADYPYKSGPESGDGWPTFEGLPDVPAEFRAYLPE